MGTAWNRCQPAPSSRINPQFHGTVRQRKLEPGYLGALYHNRQLTCCFCSCNLFLVFATSWHLEWHVRQIWTWRCMVVKLMECPKQLETERLGIQHKKWVPCLLSSQRFSEPCHMGNTFISLYMTWPRGTVAPSVKPWTVRTFLTLAFRQRELAGNCNLEADDQNRALCYMWLDRGALQRRLEPSSWSLESEHFDIPHSEKSRDTCWSAHSVS